MKQGWGISEASLTCRDYRHSWRPKNARVVERGYERTLQCRSCGTQRVEVLHGTGQLLTRRYHYPEGFLLPKGTTIDMDEVRIEATLRLIDKATKR